MGLSESKNPSGPDIINMTLSYLFWSIVQEHSFYSPNQISLYL